MRPHPPQIDTRNSAVFLDVDGTLLSIEPHPDDVRATPELIDLLANLSARLDGALALVSGRALDALDRIFDPLTLPSAGAHGSQIRFDDAVTAPGEHALPDSIGDCLAKFAAQHSGLLLETKPGGASLHYRQAPELESQCRQFMQTLAESLVSDFRLIDGKKVLELAPLAANKGEAIRHFLRHPPFAGRRPVFVGDDVTDEDGFRTVRLQGGVAVCVGERESIAAEFELADVAAVHAWLQAHTTPEN